MDERLVVQGRMPDGARVRCLRTAIGWSPLPARASRDRGNAPTVYERRYVIMGLPLGSAATATHIAVPVDLGMWPGRRMMGPVTHADADRSRPFHAD
jgi:hypothetical protein